MTAKEYLRSEHCVAKCPDELYVDNEFKKWKENQS
jgi:hypothetical protein